MKLSHNVLVIESLSTFTEESDHTVRVRGEMNASIEFNCSVNGAHFRSLMIKSEGKGFSGVEALREAIQNFIDGKFYSENINYDKEIESIPCHNIHRIDIRVAEPFKSLFEQLFDMSSWQIPKRELPSGDVS